MQTWLPVEKKWQTTSAWLNMVVLVYCFVHFCAVETSIYSLLFELEDIQMFAVI